MIPSTSQFIAEVVSNRGREGIVESSDNTLRLDLASDQAPTPEHLFAGAFAACYHSALKKAAQNAHVEIPGSTVIARVGLADDDSGDTSHLTVELRVALPGVDESVGRKLLDQATSTCPYARAVRGNVQVKVMTD